MRIMSPYTLKWLPGGRERNDISLLIRESYSQVYHATLSACMPWLPGLYDSRGEVTPTVASRPPCRGHSILNIISMNRWKHCCPHGLPCLWNA